MKTCKYDTTSKANVDLYETTEPLFNALYKEIQELTKKKPDGTLNQAKIKMINRLLHDIHTFLEDEPGIKYIDFLDDESLPQYSDVTLILSQWSTSVKAFKLKYHGYDSSERIHKWYIK